MRLLPRSRQVAGASASQVLVAGSSLVLQLVAARAIGADGLGTFSLLTSVLVAFNSVQTGWIGDSLTVLDRFEPTTRAALLRSQAVSVVLGFGIGFASAVAGGFTGPGLGVVFGAAVALWAVEDTCRRLFMVRQEYWSLVANDAVYAVASLGFVALVAGAGHAVTLGTLIWSLTVGAVAACVAGRAQLPAAELSLAGRASRADLRRLSSFASWRAAQVGIRPSAALLMRVLVAGLVSPAALGRLEAARLVLAPVHALVNAAGTVLLPAYARAARHGSVPVRRVGRAMGVLAAGVLAWGLVALVALDVVGPLVTGDSFRLAPLAVVSWTLLGVGFAASIPPGVATVALRRSRRAFFVRLSDSCLGLVLVVLVLAAGAPALAPAALAVGALAGAAALFADLRRPER